MARNLLIGAAAGLAAALIVAVPAGNAVGELAVARGKRDALQTLSTDKQKPPPLVAPRNAVAANSLNAAQAKLAARVKTRAVGGGVLIEELAGAKTPADSGVAQVRIRLSGSAKAILALCDAVERETPAARFTAWRIEAIADDSVRLTGTLAAPWHG